MHISKLDHRFDYFEERWITLGTTTKDKILVVANMFFDENGEEIIRIISARKANQKKGYSMSNIKDREKYDDYEMLEEYDFSDGVRGRFYEPKKIPVSLRLDNDIVLFFKKLASEQKVPYQTLINALLRKKLQEV
jgi:predicted DNA binding CopG/RHH family protein